MGRPGDQRLDVGRLRKELGLSQREMGILMGVHPWTVSQWERGAGKVPRHRQVLEVISQIPDRALAGFQAKRLLEQKGYVYALYFLLDQGFKAEGGRAT